MRKKLSIKRVWAVIKKTVKNFGNHRIPTLSASLAYYTVFSLAPLLVMLIALGSIFFGNEIVEGKVNATLAGFLGAGTADQLQDLIKNASLEGKNTWAAIIGGVTLLIGASTVFGQIQESINYIWGIRAKAKKGWLRMIKSRLLSFSIIATLGFLLLVSLAVSAVLDAFGNRLKLYFPDATVVLFYVINAVITLVIVTLIFAVIFRLLPDSKTPWRDIWGGAVITGILFMIGKFAISAYISKAHVGETYGAAGALVILLVWVYYSAMILYFGAAITRYWVEDIGDGIKPDEDAATTKLVELEMGEKYKRK